MNNNNNLIFDYQSGQIRRDLLRDERKTTEIHRMADSIKKRSVVGTIRNLFKRAA